MSSVKLKKLHCPICAGELVVTPEKVTCEDECWIHDRGVVWDKETQGQVDKAQRYLASVEQERTHSDG